MNSIKKIAISTILAGVFATSIYLYASKNSQTIAVWGEKIECSDVMPVINSGVMQRLKKIDQAGAARYFGVKLPPFSRFDHSVGVYALLKKAGVSDKEQVAGLLHDASHTVFSHVGDYIWARNINDYNNESLQDKIHINYLHKNKIEQVLKSIGMTIEDTDIEKNDYKALEQNLPDMCADRIQYNIHTGLIMKMIDKKDVKEILNDLEFKGGKWFFKDAVIARKFANLSLYFTQNFWGAKWNTMMNIHFANALKRAIEINLINKEELFSTDDAILNKLRKSDDKIIKANLKQCDKPLNKLDGQRYKSEKFYPKFRGIDPLIRRNSGDFVRLSEIDTMFKSNYDTIKKWCQDGYEIEILEP